VAVRVALRVLLVRMVTLPKFKAVGLEVNLPAEIPLPARAIVKVGFEGFETTAIAPLALPTIFGVKRILKVTLWYLNRYVKLTMDYEHTVFKMFNSRVNPLHNENVLMNRVQLAF
jgi:hypothetical protein